ncbi:MAG: hypothetical protein QXE05_09505 [Nitrososphaeria archaeon]
MSVFEKEKRSTISVRVGPELYSKFSLTCEILGLDKSDFLKTCIQKLVDDNRIFLENKDKTKSALDYIKIELSKLPSDLVVLKNGTFNQVKDVTIYVLCDELFRTSEKVWLSWNQLVKEYTLDLEASKGENLFEVEDLGLLALPSEKMLDAIDIIEPVYSVYWTNQLELKKITLLLSTVDAIRKFSVDEVVREALEYEAANCPKRLSVDKHYFLIDAKGEIRRKGDTLIVPASIEHKLE